MGDNVHCRKGNNPDRRLRSLNSAQWERMWERPDNQEVGLEAATLERVRNSSLVQRTCAENVPGLKRNTEAADFARSGRGAFHGRRRLTDKDSWSAWK
jgi:hypothetical protein